ncbi:site-specific integrase [Stagnimonas aquatica]|uniref:Site-specific integrase n=1 Tax=Stagnimonas aquatica TaxID=2689987 RepID=A0A3N0V1L3_9GAMM|nr:site-specific integrase [Stagnimonas aquatica]ROH86421.1 site-specific integrase [Stagnimonas aquatica]
MATFVKVLAKSKNGTPDNKAGRAPTYRHKAVVRLTGWPTCSKTFRLKKDAEDWARRIEDEMVRGVFIQRAPSERTTLKAALERYETEVTPRKRPSSRASEVRRIATLKRELGSYSLAALTPDLVASFRDKRLNGDIDPNTGERRRRAPNTVRLELALLSHLFSLVIKEWRLGVTSNPVMLISKPSPGPGRNRRLSQAEEDRLMPYVDRHSNPMLRWIVRIALETGMRSSEITSLRCNQVDTARRIVRLEYTKNTTARTVPLTKTATAIFVEALNHAARPPDTDLIFFGEPGEGGVRRPYEFNKVWAAVRSKAGLYDFHFHDLRHEAVSRLVESGLGDQEVAAISGHKSMQMLKRYTHLRSEDLVDRLDQMTERRSAKRDANQAPA